MDKVEELLEKMKTLSPEEKKKLRQELKNALKAEKAKKEIPEEARQLINEYQQLRDRLIEIRKKLLEEYNLTPAGEKPRKGYGIYDYRGTPAYNTVVEILSTTKNTPIEKLEQELKKRGYKGITGTIGVILKNLREDGLITREGDYIIWLKST